MNVVLVAAAAECVCSAEASEPSVRVLRFVAVTPAVVATPSTLNRAEAFCGRLMLPVPVVASVTPAWTVAVPLAPSRMRLVTPPPWRLTVVPALIVRTPAEVLQVEAAAPVRVRAPPPAVVIESAPAAASPVAVSVDLEVSVASARAAIVVAWRLENRSAEVPKLRRLSASGMKSETRRAVKATVSVIASPKVTLSWKVVAPTTVSVPLTWRLPAIVVVAPTLPIVTPVALTVPIESAAAPERSMPPSA